MSQQTRRGRRGPGRTAKPDLLEQDVAAMIREHPNDLSFGTEAAEELAHDIIVVVRERVLREIASYARENIR